VIEFSTGREVGSSVDLLPSTVSTCELSCFPFPRTRACTNGSAWNWDSMFAAMKKSETFTPPTEEITQDFTIGFNTENHGTDGPLHYSYPGYLLPVVGEWTTVLENIGVSVSPDPNGGNGWGAFIATSSINPSNW
jgi:choline dehydrogenase